jgi:aryl-alcohol dehydrogenase-like predicted oxidoreductase
MRYNSLGRTGLKISELCLGSMTWGTQTSQHDAHRQIDTSLEHGVNIIDTAEMYPVNPLLKKTQGDTERIIGDWVVASGRRSDVLLATKASGAGHMNVRDGAPISSKTIRQAVESSLTSLRTDYIDLYQLHWPNRGSYMFRQNWTFDATNQNKAEVLEHMNDTLEELQRLVDAGKIRHFGLSNESAWGTAQWLRLSEDRGLPRVASIQNEYSLLCRLFDLDLAELAHNEDVGLLAFSPVAAGLLSGKYAPDVTPQGSRRSFSDNLGGRITPQVWGAVNGYLSVAEKHGLRPVQMALAWCCTRPFMASAIFGATTQDQLVEALGAVDVVLSDEVLADIQAVYREHPMPF